MIKNNNNNNPTYSHPTQYEKKKKKKKKVFVSAKKAAAAEEEAFPMVARAANQRAMLKEGGYLPTNLPTRADELCGNSVTGPSTDSTDSQ